MLITNKWSMVLGISNPKIVGADERTAQQLALINMDSRSCWVRAHLHQRGAGPPEVTGSVFRAGRVFTLARVRAQFHFTGAPFCGTGSLIYKYRPTNQRSLFLQVPQKNRSVSEILGRPPRARSGGRAGPRHCTQHHTIPSNRSTAEPAGGIRAGAPRVFRVGVNAPLNRLYIYNRWIKHHVLTRIIRHQWLIDIIYCVNSWRVHT